MRKNDASQVLMTVFKDISSIENVIQKSKEIEQLCVKLDFDNENEIDKVIESTRTILDSIKSQVIKIEEYFHKNCASLRNDTVIDIVENDNVNEKSLEVIVSSLGTAMNRKVGNRVVRMESEKSEEVSVSIENTNSNQEIGNDSEKQNEEQTTNTLIEDVSTDKESEKDIESVGSEQDSQNNEDQIELFNNDAVDQLAIKDEDEFKAERKVFLKCVDINTLINPDALPVIPTNSTKTNCLGESILIISDSDPDDPIFEPKSKFKHDSLNIPKTRASRNLRNREKLKQSYEDNSESLGSKQTKLKYKSDARARYKKMYDSSNSDTDSTLSSYKKKSQKKRKKSKISEQYSSAVSNDSDSSSSMLPLKSQKTTDPSSRDYKKLIEEDKKLSQKAYLPLPRIPCENLKDHYLKQKEMNESERLVNISNLEKSTQKYSAENANKMSSSNKNEKCSNRKRKRINNFNSSRSDVTEDDSMPVLQDANKEVEPIPNTTNNIVNNKITDIMFDAIDSETEVIKDDEETDKAESNNKVSKTQNKKENSDSSNQCTEEIISNDECQEDISQTNEKDQSQATSNSKSPTTNDWQKDKLLTNKLSDSDSEEDFLKYKNLKKNKENDKVKASKRKQKVISSDSEESDKNCSGSKEKSSDNTNSESEDENKKISEKKKHTRIVAVIDSSDDDADKTTRKSIRKVIGHNLLAETTKQAEKDEKERKARITERQKKYNKIFDCDEPIDASVDKLVLDFNEETKEEILVVHKNLVKKLKPHQAKGVQFMWDACYESVERAKNTKGSGCILAHCMGLGKTLQVITLIHTLLLNAELTGVHKVLVVCPLNTVLNWVSEFKKWLDDIEGEEIEVYELVGSKQNERQYQVDNWHNYGGVIVIGYDMFRNLTNPTNKRIKKNARDIFSKGLVNPGPDLVVCDEGHLLKNEKTNISIAMNRINSVRRIVLTGTPMQNNLKEYYCMVQFVKPNLLGTYKEYLNRFVNPITNGQYTDSTPHDIDIMRKRSHVLHKMLDGLVQRKDYSVLMPFLPPKYEYVLFLTLSEVQIKLYQHYKDHYSQRPTDNKVKSTFLFMDFQEFQRICTHPRILLNKSEENKKKAFLEDCDEDSEGSLKDFIDDNSDSSSSSSSGENLSDSSASKESNASNDKAKKQSHVRLTRNTAAAAGIDVEEIDKMTANEDQWWSQYCDGEELDNIAHSSKLYLLFQILQQCELIGDKLLVFSQSLYSLTVIEYFLAKIDEATQKGELDQVCGFSGSWSLGLDYFRLDGSSSCDNRAAWCNNFNNIDNPRARLFLISTKAGGLGINLVGANRVIIFDVSWNPSHDIQSIYRIYRFGQTKPSYIYRFVIWGTMEMKLYERQVTKQAISKRVIDEQQIDRHYNQNDLAELYFFDPKPSKVGTPLLPKDVLLAELLQKEKERIYKYHEHQTLLENKEDEELDEAERKAAWEEFENERIAPATSNAGWIKYLPVNTVTEALMRIVQKDNPTWLKEQVLSVIPMIMKQLREQVDMGQMQLYNRIVNEIRLNQISQQQRLHEYMQQQQMRLLQQRFINQQRSAITPRMNYNLGNILKNSLANQSTTGSSSEIVELND